LIAALAAIRTPDGEPLDLALTTNGSLLARKVAALRLGRRPGGANDGRASFRDAVV
jgi:hypothetical protein